jgi:hypothetical protein
MTEPAPTYTFRTSENETPHFPNLGKQPIHAIPAQKLHGDLSTLDHPGIDHRTHIATQILAGLAANPETLFHSPHTLTVRALALTDNLLDALEPTEENQTTDEHR